MATVFHVTGMTNATISKDRSKFDIGFKTDRGEIILSVGSAHLDALITNLQGLEYHSSLLDPKTGQRPGELGQIRAEIVDHHQIGNGVVNGVPSVFLGLKSTQVFRWFALDGAKALALCEAVKAETQKLQGEPPRH